jgi:hypothetical protein
MDRFLGTIVRKRNKPLKVKTFNNEFFNLLKKKEHPILFQLKKSIDWGYLILEL